MWGQTVKKALHSAADLLRAIAFSYSGWSEIEKNIAGWDVVLVKHAYGSFKVQSHFYMSELDCREK